MNKGKICKEIIYKWKKNFNIYYMEEKVKAFLRVDALSKILEIWQFTSAKGMSYKDETK